MDQWRVRHSKAMFSLKRADRGEGLYDYDGREYQSVIIGSQEWLLSGYSPLHYADGEPIQHLPDADDWAAATEGAWCYYGNSQENLSTYGRLYNQFTKSSLHGFVYLERGSVHETGWRVPLSADFVTLYTALGGANIAGGKMKTAGTTYWAAPNVGATNSSGFSGRGGGYRTEDGLYVGLGEIYLMSTAEAYAFFLEYSSSLLFGWAPLNREGMYVRLVRDI